MRLASVESFHIWSQLVKVNKWAVQSWTVSWLQGMSGEEKKTKQYLALCHIPILPGTGRAEEEEGGRFLLLLLPCTKLRIRALLLTKCVLSFHSYDRCALRAWVSSTWSRCGLLIWSAPVCFLQPPPGRTACLHREAWAGTEAETQTVTQQPLYQFP